jgi:hypothetical protein
VPVLTRSAGALLVSVLALASPAAADTGTVRDPAGDAVTAPQDSGLDVTGATVDNGARRLVVTVSFDALERGSLVVSVAPRGESGVRLVTTFRPGHRARSFVVAGSFEDSRPGGRVGCARYGVVWDQAAATARLSVPPRCLARGYDDVRFALLTETDGADTDYAPDAGHDTEDLGHTRWIARG